ncbi:nuclear transport factor 2 family protein [Actinocatenispora rupis]|uniref:SnoaL-like domain-containing protein n=1 Tax=Actinocatenispora rupis TaxID=519421 RepID=A0A8J3J2P8_9ACTN|nr:nuclear transport factor 2 family protein [Actinocatenispora rupis]GID11005.1 hypothetical protein Aru02nite_18940 [Actinocatenispora rupis]
MDNAAAVERYVEFWNAAEGEPQRRLAALALTEDVEYHAPVGALTGPQALIDFRNEFLAHVGGATLAVREEPQHHHDRSRLKWDIRLADGASFATGTDVLVVAADGRIGAVTSFLDRAPAGFPHEHD